MLGATLSRSVPFGESFAVTLQNAYSVTRTHPDATAPAGAAQSWATNQALRFNVLPTDTSLLGDLEHGRQVAAHIERRAEAVRWSAQRHRLGQRDRERRHLEEPKSRLQADVVEASSGRGR